MSAAEQLPLYGKRPLVLGIAGCSGSGKTTLARELAAQLDGTLLPLDFYYRDLRHLEPEVRARRNFDHPDSLESDLLTTHVEALSKGQSVGCPIYDFASHTRVTERTQSLVAAQVLIVEGILALHYEALRQLYDFSIYVNAPHEVCLARRIYRDIRERGRTEESVLRQYEETARPMADLYVLPSAKHASITVEGTDALDWSVEQVLQSLHQAALIRPANTRRLPDLPA